MQPLIRRRQLCRTRRRKRERAGELGRQRRVEGLHPGAGAAVQLMQFVIFVVVVVLVLLDLVAEFAGKLEGAVEEGREGGDAVPRGGGGFWLAAASGVSA